ncbi:50S ribosomal protein L17 [Tyzzerella sp. An114]|uniref:bL17 family ribosomal protein n=1 Tax=Tyzzerella sp. An114 TaxID=1965545 RepID=UPI000B43C845|nr:L17 family ribosomal protein [Tyzzerella sp. An114]OUQ58478.1 50S ribosomal protein L17 [Tyzzerella sp. An114]HIT73724.1 50S ribosomal protein L17 [Candidatus Fimicola cottocaccae]
MTGSGYRKLGKTSAQRKALLRNQVTNLLYHGKIKTTEARAKEVRRLAEKLITLAVKEKDNFTEVEVTAKVAKKDANGKRVKETVNGKKVTVFDEVKKTIKKDNPSRLNARRKMLSVLYPVTEVPADGKKVRKLTKKVDMCAKLFDEIAPKYVDRKGGYTRIIKIGPRKGDGAPEVIIELV